ncbi:MAG: hypothetical protein NTX17_01070 [Candidatus Eisenbacteria bacterium]|nr:hypothetical protein [Candidatus Eisenbacteria bacterium]
MRGFAKVACVLFLLGVLLVPEVGSADPDAAGVTAQLTYISGPPGNRLYRFDYTVENFTLEPFIWGFVVFFDADGQDRSDFVSYTYPSGWEDIFVYSEPEGGGAWSVEWDGGYDHPNPIYPGESLNGFSVTFVWKDLDVCPGSQEFEVWNSTVFEGTTVVILTGPTGFENTSWGCIKNAFR